MCPAYTILHFQGSRLDRSEAIDAESPIEALEEAAKRPSDDLVEVWSGDRKLATFRPVRRHG